MKIIFITREGYRLPGARVRCYNFSQELSRLKVATEVLSFADTLGAKDGENESGMGFKEKIAYNWRAFKRLAKEKDAFFWIQRFNYHAFAPYLAHILNHNKIILDLDDWEMRENPAYYFKFYPSSKAHFFTRQLARKSIFCVAASHYLREFLLEFNKNVYYIPSGVDTELFTPPAGGLDKEKIVFSWVGTFHKPEYVDNLRFALECFCALRKRYNQIYFEITGDGIYRDLIVKEVNAAFDAHIQLKDWIAPEKIPDYLAGIQIGLLPVARDTKFNRAKSPTKLFEYMSMAKPVVASKIGEAAVIIKDGYNGYLADDQEQFIARMQELINDAPARQKIGQLARQTVEQDYSLQVLGKKLREILMKTNV